MFFSSPKKKGREAGEMLWKQLSVGFLSMENLPLGGFNLPSNFFDDEYTLVYTITYVEALRVHQYSGKNWSPTKRAEFLEAAFFEVEPSGNLLKKVVEKGDNVLVNGKKEENEIQINASDAAYATVGLLLGFISSDDQNPVVRDAKTLAEVLSRSRPNDPFKVTHSASITTRTISSRTKERYGDRFNPSWWGWKDY